MVAPKPGTRRPGTPAFGGNTGSAPKAGPANAPRPGGAAPGGSGLAGFFADVDFDSVETRAQLSVGQHLAEVASMISNFTSNGNPQLEVTFKVLHGVNAGRTTKYWVVKTEKTIWKVKQFLASLGYTDEEMKTNAVANPIGRQTILVVAPDDFRADGSTRVVNTLPYDPEFVDVDMLEQEPMTDDQAAE